MMRISYRQLISEEEKLESEVTACWDAFLASLQGALEFVNVQTPLIMKNLSVAVKVTMSASPAAASSRMR